MKPKYFAIVDLEATCCDKESFPRSEMEIIEIGLVLVETVTFKQVAEFQSFVKPVRNPTLTQFCKELTKIPQLLVDEAPAFTSVIQKLNEFLTVHDGDVILCSWGRYDKRQLLQDCDFHGVKYPFDNRHINIKDKFATVHNLTKACGVSNALKTLNKKFIGTPHRGLDDARNIARLFQSCYQGRFK